MMYMCVVKGIMMYMCVDGIMMYICVLRVS
jgi:hypothetical protein